jgi:hypothetical protein
MKHENKKAATHLTHLKPGICEIRDNSFFIFGAAIYISVALPAQEIRP